jgi:hypothetical protein
VEDVVVVKASDVVTNRHPPRRNRDGSFMLVIGRGVSLYNGC